MSSSFILRWDDSMDPPFSVVCSLPSSFLRGPHPTSPFGETLSDPVLFWTGTGVTQQRRVRRCPIVSSACVSFESTHVSQETEGCRGGRKES